MKLHTHDDTAGDIPQELCRLCHPELNLSAERRAALDEADRARVKHEASALVKQHRLRKLRAEERRLSNLIDEIGNRDNAARRRLYAAIKVVEKEIEANEG